MAETRLAADDTSTLAQVLRTFGCPGVVALNRANRIDSPGQIPYLDLLSKYVRQSAPLLPDAVAEFQGRPVMYVLDARSRMPDAITRRDLQQRLANRGDHAVLAIVRPGDITLHPLHLSRRELDKHGHGTTISMHSPEAPFLFHAVATGKFKLPGQSEHADPVFREIQKLLVRAIEDLVDKCHLGGLTVLSMIGRALFFRFLVDRRIVEQNDLEDICPAAKRGGSSGDLASVFSDALRAAQTSAWLDETFNGDLLPLLPDTKNMASPQARRKAYEKVYSEGGTQSAQEVFRHLEAILRGWDHVDGHTQIRLPIDWDDLNFCHIPIGVLSQVYEDFSHRVDELDARRRSVHYTPRNLAKLLVEEALAGLEMPHEARVLDPACGAGVFLVLALRQLVKLRWEHDLRERGPDAPRPSKSVIQSILHRQIRGFDVSPSALRLAALALYVTVIELNEITRPPGEHHAGRALQDLVLFDQRTADEKNHSGAVLGSLGDAVGTEFDGQFEVVVGNPPWTRYKDDAKTSIDEVGTEIARRVLERRGLSEIAAKYKNPAGVPDLPFVWRAMEWAKPGGILAFALDARLILATSGSEAEARNALFQALSVTGILNGSDVEKTNVWAGHDLPWILLWARQEKPNLDEHTFHLLTPLRENELADSGEFRLDFQSAYPVPLKKALEHGWLFKALAMGTVLDVEITEKLVSAEQSVGSFWNKGKARSELASGRGMDLQPWKAKPAPSWLLDLPVADLEIDSASELAMASDRKLATFRDVFGTQEPYRPYSQDNYRAPLLLISRAPGDGETTSIKSYRYRREDRCFTKNYFGYSGGTHERGQLAIALLHILSHSKLFQHFAYMCSGQIGARRRIVDKQDIDAFPFPVLETLTPEQMTRTLELADMLDGSAPKDWEALETFVCELFGLTNADQQVVEDTVEFNGPYRSVREPAARPVPDNEMKIFARTLEKSLQLFFKVAGQKLEVAPVAPIEQSGLQTWRFVTLLLAGDTWSPAPKVIAEIMAEATKTSASRLVMRLPEGGLLLGLINKRRFWTRSRARLCAMHIAREHLGAAFRLEQGE